MSNRNKRNYTLDLDVKKIADEIAEEVKEEIIENELVEEPEEAVVEEPVKEFKTVSCNGYSGLNVRSAPNGSVVRVLSNGEKVEVKSVEGEWTCIGINEFVKSAFLK